MFNVLILLYVMAESEMELREKIVKWKAGMQVKGLKVNTRKMKVNVWLLHNRL